jgi:hypothetical protein
MVTKALPGQKFRVLALLTGSALAVHQLRYLLAHGGHSGEQLGVQGHAYLGLILPLVSALVTVAAVGLALRLLEARRTATREPGLPDRRILWAGSSSILLCVYSFQEWLEGHLEPGRESGVGAVFAHGGWWAIPLAVVLGALVACLLRGAARAIELVAARRRIPRRSTHSPARTSRERPSQKPALDVVASFRASRGPPVTSN